VRLRQGVFAVAVDVSVPLVVTEDDPRLSVAVSVAEAVTVDVPVTAVVPVMVPLSSQV
jgi:hypothetical protein